MIRTIRLNLFFAAGGLTGPGILTPVNGELLHERSSIPVIKLCTVD